MKPLLKILLAAILVFGLSLSALVLDADAAVRVRGYFRSDGTYVRPHYRSSPDGNPYNNWSFPGNTNPYTGEAASGNPDTYLRNYYGNSSPSRFTPSTTIYSPPSVRGTRVTDPLVPRINSLFRSAYGRNPSPSENRYWLTRIPDKPSEQAMIDAMKWHRIHGLAH